MEPLQTETQMSTAINDDKLNTIDSDEKNTEKDEALQRNSINFWLQLHDFKNTAIADAVKKENITLDELQSFTTSDINEFIEFLSLSFMDKKRLKTAMQSLPIPTEERNQEIAKESRLKRIERDNTSHHELSNRVEAYSSFEVVSSLLFGFSVSFLFSDAKTEYFDDTILEISFTFIMSLVLILSAYSMIVVSITHYFVNRFIADNKYQIASVYLQRYRVHRQYARWSFYVAVICLIISLGIYLYSQLHIISSIVSIIILGIGSIFLSYTLYIMLNPHKNISIKDERKGSDDLKGSVMSKRVNIRKMMASQRDDDSDSDDFKASVRSTRPIKKNNARDMLASTTNED